VHCLVNLQNKKLEKEFLLAVLIREIFCSFTELKFPSCKQQQTVLCNSSLAFLLASRFIVSGIPVRIATNIFHRTQKSGQAEEALQVA
jgi:uncharacterized membrane protein HdeD (DUF308 family)